MTDKDVGAVRYKVAPGVSISSTGPNATEARAKKDHEEIVALARRGEYEFIGTKELEDHTEVNLYKFALSDGRSLTFGSDCPIDQSPLLIDGA